MPFESYPSTHVVLPEDDEAKTIAQSNVDAAVALHEIEDTSWAREQLYTLVALTVQACRDYHDLIFGDDYRANAK